MIDDSKLLQDYASHGSDEAFRALMERYVNLVYSAARRQTADGEMAKDVTQSVFLTLARRAGSINADSVLAGWLLRTTRFAAANARRLAQRRAYYEQQAMDSLNDSHPSTPGWQRVAPLLDEALDAMAQKDRDAVALRYFEGLPLKEVARCLSLSEDGAQKRVGRAVEKLRAFFARRGVHLTLGALASGIAAHAVQPAPQSLKSSVLVSVTATGAGSSGSSEAIAQATLKALDRAATKSLALRAAGTTAAAAVAVALMSFSYSRDVAITRADETAGTVAPSGSTGPALGLNTDHEGRVPAADLAPGQGTLEFEVLDAVDSMPISGARLTLVSTGYALIRTTNTFRTDVNGKARIEYANAEFPHWSHRIEVFRDDYVPKFVSWSEAQQDRLEEIPTHYTVRLDPAVTIGGRVVDDQNAFVAGARVVFSVSGPIPSRSRERLTLMGNYHSETTGTDGRWTCSHVPARFGMISFKPVHQDFQEQTWMTDAAEAARYLGVEKIAQSDFLAQTALMRLQRGLEIAGLVLDEGGHPVGNARVTQSFEYHRSERTALTGADGRFVFGNGRTGNLWLTAQAPGLAPMVTSMVLSASVDNLRIVLPAGRELRGRVVDPEGNPIPGASLGAASPSGDSRRLFEWGAKTDSDGRFAWDAAPSVQFYAVRAAGFESVNRLELRADGLEHPIQLKRQIPATGVSVLGRAMDAQTKQPLQGVKVQLWESRVEADGGVSTFTTVPEDANTDGTFQFKTEPGVFSYALEVQADGYWPKRLTNQVEGGQQTTFYVELDRR